MYPNVHLRAKHRSCILTQDFAEISKQGCVDTDCHKAYGQIGHAVHAGCALPCRGRPGFVLQRRKARPVLTCLDQGTIEQYLRRPRTEDVSVHTYISVIQSTAFIGCSILCSLLDMFGTLTRSPNFKAECSSIAKASKLPLLV